MQKCYCLKNVKLNPIFAENVIDMNSMFKDCYNLTNLNLDSFYTKNVTDMSCMFSGCESLNIFFKF